MSAINFWRNLMKKNSFVVSVILVAMLAATSSSVYAEGSASELAIAPPSPSGIYAGFEFGYAPISGSATSSSHAALGGRVGYAFNQNISAEASWDYMGSFNSGLSELMADVLAVSAVGYYPIQDGLDVYGKLGYARANVGTTNWVNNVNKNKTAMTYGFGVELGHGKKNTLRLGMDHYDLSAWTSLPITANNFSISADFRF
jgi:hypothetical protein